MNKLVVIETHGVTIVEGTVIHVMAAFNMINTHNESLVGAFMYDERGVLVERKVGRYQQTQLDPSDFGGYSRAK